MQGSANLNIMFKVARAAGRILLKDFTEIENLQGHVAGAVEFAQKSHERVSQKLREELTEARKTYGYLATGEEEMIGEDPTRRWLVAPVMGPLNFAKGSPMWGISIALEHKGNVVSAVVHDPVTDEMFFSEKGLGAWLNERRIRASDQTHVSDAVVSAPIPARNEVYLPAVLRELAQVAPACAGVRSSGATGMDVIYLAAGRLDAMWARNFDLCDVAGPQLIAREAGVLFEPIRPNQDPNADKGFIGATGAVFHEFAKTVRATED